MTSLDVRAAPATSVPTDGDGVVSELTVHRVAGLPAREAQLGAPATGAALLCAEAEEERATRLASTLGDRLYAAVPAALPADRRLLLRLRRDVHNLRRPDAGLLAAVREVLPADLRCTLDGWAAAVTAADDALDAAQQSLQRELDAVGRRLRDALNVPEVADALALTSPDFARHGQHRELACGTRAARTAVLYVTRAALKTSPLSGLTTVGLQGRPADGARRSRPTMLVVHRHVTRCLDDPELLWAFDLVAAPLFPGAAGTLFTVSSTPVTDPTFPWRVEEPVDARLYADQLRELAGHGQAPARYWAVVLGAADPVARLRRLLDAGLLRPVLPWRTGEPAPLLRLADRLELRAGPAGRAAAEALRDQHHKAARVARMPAAARLARPVADVVEDVSSPVTVPPLGPHVRHDLRRLAAMLRPYLFRSHVYDVLVERFRDRHGSGGSVPDAAAFFVEAAADERFGAHVRRAQLEDLRCFGRRTDRAWLPVSASSAPPAAAVLYQLDAPDLAAVRNGRYLLVVNQVTGGAGGTLSRFTDVLAGPGGLAQGLAGWARDSHPDAEALGLTLSADISSLQHVGSDVLPPLRWPGDLPLEDPDLTDVSTLTLRHVPADGTLLLLRPDGGPVAPVYVGIVPTHLVHGPARLLLALAEPWVNGATVGDASNPYLPTPEPPDVPVHDPRRQSGRLVLRRARVRCRGVDLPVPLAGEPTLAHLRRVGRWQRQHGVSSPVFVRVQAPGAVFDGDRRKPRYLDLTSPHVLAAVLPGLGDEPAVHLVEALPGPAGHWVRDAQDDCRAVEHVSLLRWSRPGVGP